MDYKDKNDNELIKNTHALDQPTVEMMRRLKDSIERLDKSTSKHNKALILLTLILLVVALVQLITSIFVSDLSSVNKLIIEVMALGFVIICIVYLFKEAKI